ISLFSQLKEVLTSNIKSKLGAILLQSELKSLKSQLDYREYGGAPLLGTQKTIVKAHGSCDAYAIKNDIVQMITFLNMDIKNKNTKEKYNTYKNKNVINISNKNISKKN